MSPEMKRLLREREELIARVWAEVERMRREWCMEDEDR